MLLAVVTNFRASRKEPLDELLTRIHAAFREYGVGEPEIQFGLGDGPLTGSISSVDRALKRFPQLADFQFSAAPMPHMAEVRQLSNGPSSPAAGKAVEFATLQAIAQGVPRSFPFHTAQFRFMSPLFGEAIPASAVVSATTPGILVGDSWWINGRNRSLMALTLIEADPSAKKLPPMPASLAAVLAACGKVESSNQVPLGLPAPSPEPEAVHRVSKIVMEYRQRMPEIVDRAGLPHDLPSAAESRRLIGLGEGSGPKKPALDAAFKPLGYRCKAKSGTFTLRRTTSANLTVDVTLDVGTWSNSLTAFYEVQGVGFTARLPLPAARQAVGTPQYPIGDADRWRQIVQNLAMMVSELDRSFVPELEAASGPAPEWFKP